MSNPFIGQIQSFGFNFAPRGWALCNGQLLSIAQNSALFSLLGTNYGGNGQVTFGLPDLRGRTALHWGQGGGLSDYVIGETGGVEAGTMSVNQMPIHNHLGTLTANTGTKVGANPAGNSLGGADIWVSPPADTATVANNVTISNNGGSQPFPVLQPFLVVSWCIALEGLFPTRN
jgi:microcystin-dependent protein